MFVEDGRVVVEKCLAPNESDVVNLYERHRDHPVVVVHLRNQSVGPRTLDNVHPYWVLNKDWGDKIDLVLAHNGTIPGLQVDTSLSDTANLAAYHLRPLLRKQPSLFRSHELWHLVSALIGNSKLVLMNDKEEVVIVNPGLGRQLDNGVWVSSKTVLHPWRGVIPNAVPQPLTLFPPEKAPLAPDGVTWVLESDGKNHLRILPPVQAELISAGGA